MHVLTVWTGRKTELVDITAQVREAVAGSSGAVVTVFCPHTTAGIVLQATGEGASKVAADLETAFDLIVDESWDWQHTGEGDRNPWSHVRAAIAGSSVTIPMKDGDLALGALQAIFLCEFDGPRAREVHLVLH